MEVKPGYKQTEVGVIPADWSVRQLSTLVTSGPKNGYSGRSSKDSRGTPTLMLTATTSGQMVLNNQTVKRLEERISPRLDIFLKRGDVLVQRSNTLELVGTTAVFNGPADEYVYPDLMMRLRFRSQETAHWFWRYANSSGGRKFFVGAAAGSTGTMPKVSGASLRNMPLPFPPPSEQRAITEALSDADALAGGLDRLIAKKRDLKQAAMQQLLTGQTRLPGFHDVCEVKRFGELAVPRTERVDPRLTGVLECCVELEHIEPVTGKLLGWTSTAKDSSLKSMFRTGDILFGKLRAYLRKYWLATNPGVCSTEIWVLSHNPCIVTSEYLFQLVQVDRFIETASAAYGTHMPRSDWNVIKNYELRLPTVPEQSAIAKILTDMDAEIAMLEQRREKTRALNQAMMQELLTGKTRLI